MDTSEKYINMCRKATELQETWIPSGADWVYFIPLNPTLDSYGWEGKEGGWSGVIILAVTETDAGYYGPDTDTIDEYLKNKKVFWLPRIDQLISLHREWLNSFCETKWNDVLVLSALFSDRNLDRLRRDYTTPEERILKGIYLRQYNKVWNGEDWI